MLSSISTKKYRIIISIIFGLFCFIINIMPVYVFSHQGHDARVFVGLFLPLIITIAWGYKYGLISILVGCQSIWLQWSIDGYGTIYTVGMLILWIVLHGLVSDRRTKSSGVKWYLSVYTVELMFWLVMVFGYLTVYVWLVSLNPSTIINTSVSLTLHNIMIGKHIVYALFCLVVSDVMLRKNAVKRFFRIEFLNTSAEGIIAASILVALFITCFDALAHILFTDTKMGYVRYLFSQSARNISVRSVILISCIVFGVLVYVFYERGLQHKRMYEAAAEKSKYDALTGLYNKEYMNTHIRQILENDEVYPISIIYADINGIIRINDAHGFEYGDRVIKMQADIFTEYFENTGTVFRIGGASFAIVLPNTDEKWCYEMLDEIRERTTTAQMDDISFSAAFGCATHIGNGGQWEHTVLRAESRMQASKRVSKDSQRSTVMNSFMKALFERSHETEEHVTRMQNVAEGIARTLDMNQNEIETLLLAAQFHDIGKMGIPDSILLKPDKLTDEEWKTMKTHCVIGHRIVSAAGDMNDIADIVLAHHERWDGCGYPWGLKGDEVPIEARIIAVADAYDAMTNDRVYQSRRTVDYALKEIKKSSGSQFDPAVVEAFLSFMISKQIE